jgi:glucose-1-phosphate cytidylyltransferase
MKVVILAGGYGTRISEESHLRPKPMIEVGNLPILWHIMKIYAHHGCRDFVICAGYKGYMIKEYFCDYALHRADITVDLADGSIEYHRRAAEPWRVTIIDTGADTLTGGRLKRIAPFLDADEPFCMTYGDGVSDIDITQQLAFHRAHGLDATLTAVQPPGRYGATELDGDQVRSFMEKPVGDGGGYVNGGFFVLHPRVLDRIAGDQVVWEAEPLQGLAQDGQLAAFRHRGFWQPMDTLRDKNVLEALWQSGKAPWRVWE